MLHGPASLFDDVRRRVAGSQVSSNRRHDPESQAVCDLARRRVNAVLACIDVLLPDADVRKKRRIANRILTLCDGKDRQIKITPAATQEIVLGHIHCISRNCPMLISGEPLARELNEFFKHE